MLDCWPLAKPVPEWTSVWLRWLNSGEPRTELLHSLSILRLPLRMYQLKGLLSLRPQICMYPISTGSPHDLICKQFVFSFTVFYIKSLLKMFLSTEWIENPTGTLWPCYMYAEYLLLCKLNVFKCITNVHLFVINSKHYRSESAWNIYIYIYIYRPIHIFSNTRTFNV